MMTKMVIIMVERGITRKEAVIIAIMRITKKGEAAAGSGIRRGTGVARRIIAIVNILKIPTVKLL
jgi:hypothetical protein